MQRHSKSRIMIFNILYVSTPLLLLVNYLHQMTNSNYQNQITKLTRVLKLSLFY
jgi:hypothetical protein